MYGGDFSKSRCFSIGFFQDSNSGNLKKTQDLTPASRGQTPTTPTTLGQLQPTLANPSRSWPAPARFSQPQPVERASARNQKSPFPATASVSPNQPQLILATRQPAAGQSVPAPGATKSTFLTLSREIRRESHWHWKNYENTPFHRTGSKNFRSCRSFL